MPQQTQSLSAIEGRRLDLGHELITLVQGCNWRCHRLTLSVLNDTHYCSRCGFFGPLCIDGV
jgi:hypothetical protein